MCSGGALYQFTPLTKHTKYSVHSIVVTIVFGLSFVKCGLVNRRHERLERSSARSRGFGAPEFSIGLVPVESYPADTYSASQTSPPWGLYRNPGVDDRLCVFSRNTHRSSLARSLKDTFSKASLFRSFFGVPSTLSCGHSSKRLERLLHSAQGFGASRIVERLGACRE
ncbi:hypothetical protein EDD15DRAFT_2204768 [Pisolithus albus]|nr:hypothetical protein EDD15DRAFT_2204768 [Pisolithus albus]